MSWPGSLRIGFFAASIGLVAVVPALLGHFHIGIAVIVQVVRWSLLVGVVIVAWAVLYRVAPTTGADSAEIDSVAELQARLDNGRPPSSP